jgi:hypothetical protein
VELRGMQHTRSAVCIQCCTIIDPTTPELKILQKFDERFRVQPLLPLGARGKMHGAEWEVIGFQLRTITVEGVDYSWHEYLLFNPYKGFRYVTQYNGHWNDVKTLRALPTFTTSKGRKAAVYGGQTFSHFQNAQAKTTFVMGEFPWEVRVGERVGVDDYVAPPSMLSSEISEGEVNWSMGEYVPGQALWAAFRLPGAPPRAVGVFANQPSPHGPKVKQAWTSFFWLITLWAILMAGFVFTASNRKVFEDQFRYDQTNPGEHSFVTEAFELEGRTSNVEVDLRTDLNNNWAYFNLALINEKTGQGYDFGREVSYYHGRDGGESWSEGRAQDSVTLPRVPAGKYYLRIEPEMDKDVSQRYGQVPAMRYSVVVKRDVPSSWLLWLALPFLFIPPIWVSIRAAAFEGSRWQESDYATTSSSDGDDE